MSEQHPENLSDVNSLKITEEVKERVIGLANEIDEARSSRGPWEQRQDDYYRKRFGLRRKRNFPWPGYPNHVLPLIDSDIQKAKPAYVNAAYGVSPVVTFEPFGPEDIDPARKREELLDFRIKHKMDFFEPYCIGVDKMLQHGFAVWKVVWKFTSRKYTEFLDISNFPVEIQDALYDVNTTDVMLKKILQEEFGVDMEFEENDAVLDKAVADFRNGKTKFDLTFLEKEHNEPELIVCDPKEDLAVPSDTTNLRDARWIDYRFFASVNDIKISIRDGKYRNISEDDLLAMSGKSDRRQNPDKRLREGLIQEENVDELILLHETCLYYDIDGDGIEEKCICTWPDNDPTKILRFIELPYEHGMWPYVQVERELIDTGFYSSRGIPALDDDFQTGISASFNNDLANQLIVNTPYVKYLKGAVGNIRNRRYVPGESVELKDMNGYSIEQSVNASQGTFMVTQQQLKAWAQERIGNQSQGLSSPNNMPGAGQQGKKTAREVEEISFVSGQSQSLDILVFQNQMKWIYYQIDALYEQFGQEEEFIMTGEEPVKVNRREIRGRFNMVPTGKLENSHPLFRAQKSALTLQAFRGDPDIRQDELKKMFIADQYDPKIAKRLMISPEEKQQMQAMQQQVSEALRQKAVQEGVGIKRLDSMVELEKESGLAQIHGRRFAPDKRESKNGK